MSGDKGRRDQLIKDLVTDLKPISNPGKTQFKSFIWLAGALLSSIVLMSIRGPFRPSFAEQLAVHPQFALESALGVLAILTVAMTAFRSAIPSANSSGKQAVVAISLVVLWIGFYGYGLIDPAQPGSMAGKREHCYLEVFMVGLPALAIGLIALRGLYPLRGAFSGALVGLAAGMIPGLLMQFGCMYLVPHILSHHILPGIALAFFSAICGFFVLRPK